MNSKKIALLSLLPVLSGCTSVDESVKGDKFGNSELSLEKDEVMYQAVNTEIREVEQKIQNVVSEERGEIALSIDLGVMTAFNISLANKDYIEAAEFSSQTTTLNTGLRMGIDEDVDLQFGVGFAYYISYHSVFPDNLGGVSGYVGVEFWPEDFFGLNLGAEVNYIFHFSDPGSINYWQEDINEYERLDLDQNSIGVKLQLYAGLGKPEMQLIVGTHADVLRSEIGAFFGISGDIDFE